MKKSERDNKKKKKVEIAKIPYNQIQKKLKKTTNIDTFILFNSFVIRFC